MNVPLSTPARLSWLQALRGIAALSVLFFHAKDVFGSFPLLQKFLAQGFFGVDIFFCLSGYIMCLSCSQKKPGVGHGIHFLSSRFARIYSGYWPALALTALAAWVGLRPISGDWLNSVLLTSPLMHEHHLETAWSLVYELRFYLAISVFYFFLAGKLSMRNLTLVSSLLVLYNLAFYALSIDQIHGGQWPLRYALNGFYLEFLFGMYVFLLSQKLKFSLEHVMFLIPLVLLLLAAGSFNVLFINYELLRAATYGLAAALILVIFLALQNDSQRQPYNWLVRVGDASFSLYLIHPILLSALFAALFHLLPQQGFYLFLAMGLALIVAASWLWYVWIEQPAYQLALRLIRPILPTLSQA